MQLGKGTGIHHDAMQLLGRSVLWAIEARALTAILSHGPQVLAPPAKPSGAGDKIALIFVRGVLTGGGPTDFGTSYRAIADAAEKAGADASVGRIALVIDSPGGEVAGLPETAAVIARVAKIKPVSAIVEGTSASAAYWLTSQAHDITLTPSGEVGSVGVKMMHVDMSQMLEAAGYKITEMRSGNFKTEFSPYKPLSRAAEAAMQIRLEAVHDEFISAVSAGRGTRASAAIRKARFGEGRMFSAKEAVGHGLVDRVESPREFFKGLAHKPAQLSSVDRHRARLALERRRFGA